MGRTNKTEQDVMSVQKSMKQKKNESVLTTIKSNELIGSAVMRLFQEQAYGTRFLFGVWQRKINRHEYVLAEHQ